MLTCLKKTWLIKIYCEISKVYKEQLPSGLSCTKEWKSIDGQKPEKKFFSRRNIGVSVQIYSNYAAEKTRFKEAIQNFIFTGP